MNELQLLFLVLAALYLWECIHWLPRGSVACLTWLGKKWCVRRPGQFSGNQHGGIVLAWPLPPLGSIVAGNPLPFTLSPQGLSGGKLNGLLPLAGINTVETRGRKVYLNGKPAFKFPTQTYAVLVTRQLLELKNEKPDRRGAAIEKMVQSMFDTKAIETRWKEFKGRTRNIQWLGNGLFFYLFCYAPAMIYRFGLVRTWLPLLIGMLAFTISLAIMCYRVHKYFFPAADDDRFTHFITVLLAPATAMRGRDFLSRRLLETYHPLAVVGEFCTPQAFRAFAEKTLRDLRYTITPSYSDKEVARKEAEIFSRQTLLRTMENFLRRNKLDPDELCGAPKREETCQSFCPRCLTQFTTIDGQCADCGGVPLVALKTVSKEVPAGKTAATRSSSRS